MKRSRVLAGLLPLVAAGAISCSNEITGQPDAAGPSQPQTSAEVTASPSDADGAVRTPSTAGQPPSRATTTPGRITFAPLPGGSSPSAAPPTESAAGPLAATKPCALLPPSAAADLKVGAGAAGTSSYGRYCAYQANGLTLQVVIFDTLGLDDVVRSGTPKEITIGSHPAQQSLEPPTLCMINVGTSVSSRVDVLAGARGDATTACHVASQAAAAIEPALPAYQGG